MRNDKKAIVLGTLFQRVQMEKRTIRITLSEDAFRKYKVYCAINDLTMTEQTNKIVWKFIEEQGLAIKIVKIDIKP